MGTSRFLRRLLAGFLPWMLLTAAIGARAVAQEQINYNLYYQYPLSLGLELRNMMPVSLFRSPVSIIEERP